MIKVVKCVVLLLLVLGFVEEAIARTIYSNRLQFFKYPIPHKVYEDSKIIESRVHDPNSFFMAKIQVMGSPLGEKGNKTILVKVIEVLDGKVPANQFNVRYIKAGIYIGLPPNHAAENFYFIMGVAFEDGNLHLLSASLGSLSEYEYQIFSK